jgi:hypothetical protein
MLTPLEVGLFACAALILPLAIWSLIQGSPAPRGGFLAKYYAAEKHLNLVGNLFLLTVCANAVAKLALHFGLVGEGAKDTLAIVIGVPFGVLLLAFLGLWIKAAITVRRQSSTPAPGA